MTHASEAEPNVVVASVSAGGVEALLAFVGSLPPGFPAAVVVAQTPSSTAVLESLAERLATRTPLRVTSIDGATDLAAGAIFVAPGPGDVTFVEETARVRWSGDGDARTSVDRFLESAARVHGERVVAVVLSGGGSDGPAGARIVKEHGGVVVVQDPETAVLPQAPLAIPPTLVDVYASPDAIGEVVAEMLTAPIEPQAPGEDYALRLLLAQLCERSGIDFSLYKAPTIMRRLSRLMAAAGVRSIAEYARHLEANPDTYGRLVGAFLIKVTEFFRDPPLFDALRTSMLPELFDVARSGSGELRIWSAGTSTGEEAYSLAILCAEIARERGGDVTVRVFGTDLDENAIAYARRGVYPIDAVQRVPEPLRERYLTRVDDAYEVGKQIRGMTVFGQHDLAQRAPFPRIDLCLCRNVLIYFSKELQNRALQLFSFSLRDGGYFVVGKAESPGSLSGLYRTVDAVLKIYQRQGERYFALPPARAHETTSRLVVPRTTAPRLAHVAVPYAGIDGRGMHPPLGIFGGDSTIGTILVDRRYDIISLNGTARTMLEIHGIGVGEDLLHQINNVDSTKLRAIIDATFAEETPVPIEVTQSDASGERGWLLVSTSLERGTNVAIFLVDVTSIVGERSTIASTTAAQAERLEHAEARVENLLRRQRALLIANDQLTEANLELRSTNEQLLINAEEAASASEEIETLNEEMQATNEELETLNEELQATVEELNTSNDELAARSGDLEIAVRNRQRAMRMTVIQREAMLAGFETLAGPFVVVGVDDEAVLYASPSADRSLFADLPAGWTHGETIEVDGRRHRIDGGPERTGAFLIVRPEVP